MWSANHQVFDLKVFFNNSLINKDYSDVGFLLKTFQREIYQDFVSESSWTAWTEWSECDCEEKSQKRDRKCVEFDGEDCLGEAQESQSCDCSGD